MPCRVLFLISDTGGGHRASATAVGRALGRLQGDAVQWELVDLFVEYGPWPLRCLPRTYRPLVTHLLWLWRTLYRLGDYRAVWRLTTAAMMAWNKGRLARFFADHPADLVVSVHPLLNHAPQRVLHELQPTVPFATIVTDLTTATPVWYNPDVALLSASCDEVAAAAARAGVPAERVRVLGLPIGERFAQPVQDRAELRRALGVADEPVVLVMSGGEGMGPVVEVVTAVARVLAGGKGQLVVLCGRNRALREQLASRPWPTTVHALGFVDNVDQWMAASDCLITKAGPGTIAEALACGLPMVLNSYIPGQETGNVAYVVDNGVGAWSPDPEEVAHIVSAWLEPGNPALAAMRCRARQLARPQAATDIAQSLLALIAPNP